MDGISSRFPPQYGIDKEIFIFSKQYSIFDWLNKHLLTCRWCMHVLVCMCVRVCVCVCRDNTVSITRSFAIEKPQRHEIEFAAPTNSNSSGSDHTTLYFCQKLCNLSVKMQMLFPLILFTTNVHIRLQEAEHLASTGLTI